MDNNNSKKSYSMMITSMLIVGTIGVFRKYISLSSSLLAFFRGIIGAISLMIFALLIKREKWGKTGRKKMALMIINGIFIGINWILLFESYSYTTVAKATLAYYMQPTIVLLLSPIMFREKLTVRKLLCAAFSVLGMVFVSGAVGAEAGSHEDMRGIILGLCAACFYSAVIIINKKTDGVNSYQKTTIQLLSAAIVLIPYLLIRNEFNGSALDGRVIILVLIVGIIHTGVAYTLYFGSMSGLKAQTISALSYIDPVTAMLVSSLVLNEELTILSFAGAALIIGSAIVGEIPQKAD